MKLSAKLVRDFFQQAVLTNWSKDPFWLIFLFE